VVRRISIDLLCQFRREERADAILDNVLSTQFIIARRRLTYSG
jgi:hypothetical protein